MLRHAAVVALFIGYVIPVCLLVGWYYTDVLLWLIIVEVLIYLGIFWVFEFIKNDNPFLHRSCDQSKIIQATSFAFKVFSTTATLLLGVLIQRYKDTHVYGHVYVLFVFAAITRIFFFGFMDICIGLIEQEVSKVSESQQPTKMHMKQKQKPVKETMAISMSM